MAGGHRSSGRSREPRAPSHRRPGKADTGALVQDTDLGRAEVRPDRHHPGGRLLLVDGQESSYVDLEDPTRLDFPYVRRIGDVLDLHGGPGEPLDVVHIGGGGFTLPQYVAATRPGSRSVVFEVDGGLVEVARRALGLRTSARLKVRLLDGRQGVASREDRSADAVIIDAFDGPLVPVHLTTVEFVADVRRVLRPGGVCVLNVIDIPPLELARSAAATLLEVLPHGAALAPRRLLAGKEGGNVVLAASSLPLPLAGLQERAAAAGQPEDALGGAALAAFVGGSHPLRDGLAPSHRLARMAEIWAQPAARRTGGG
jgi:SAM-dependent methyltransferase